MTPERIEEIKHYFTDEQLDEMSREYRTMPTDGEGYAIEPEYEGMVARGNIVKLVSDVKTARAALEESQQRNGKLELYVKSLEFNREDTQKRANEKLRERDTELGEAQQTIARQQQTWKKLRDVVSTNATGSSGEVINDYDIMLNIMDELEGGES
ncbi:hypothetical protein [Paenibacillus sp. FSL K6-2859]|uniref:hypothetical protein n=1 Tax=Paenibacillus sp. FSL K6-2859 TaxID=2921482 RepID=UPI0030F86306